MRQNVLRVVRILIFIDQDVLKALLQLCENIRMVAQRMAVRSSKSSKSSGVVRLQKVLIFQENARNCLFIKARRGAGEPVSSHELVLSFADRAVHDDGRSSWWKRPAI